MCGPVAAGLMAGGAVISAVGAISSGRSQNRIAKYQAQVQRNNAKLAEANAQIAIERGERSIYQRRVQGAQEAAAQTVAMAANGIETTSGSAVDILSDTALFTHQDVETIAYNSALEARGFRAQSQDFLAQSALTRASGRAAQTAGYLAGAGTLLTGVGQAGLYHHQLTNG